MKTTDARKFNQQAKFELRKQVVRLREKGLDNQAIAEIVRLFPSHISTIWKKYERGGLDAIKPGIRGRRHGARPPNRRLAFRSCWWTRLRTS